MRRTLLAAVCGVAVVAAVVAAVALRTTPGARGPEARTVRSGPPAADPVALARRTPCPAHPGSAGRARLESFHAALLVRCVSTEARYPDGEWTVIRKELSRGSIDAFLAVLDRPDAAQPSDAACPAIAYLPVPLVLVSAGGDTISPRFPRDSCGLPQQAAFAQLQHVHFTTVSTRKLQLVQPRAAIDSGCETQWKNENAIEGADRRSRTAGSALGPGRLRVCWYQRRDDWMAGYFVRGARLDDAVSAKLRAAFSGAGVGGTCPAQREFAVVFSPSGAYANVELGGCYRVQTAEGSGRADRAVVASILG